MEHGRGGARRWLLRGAVRRCACRCWASSTLTLDPCRQNAGNRGSFCPRVAFAVRYSKSLESYIILGSIPNSAGTMVLWLSFFFAVLSRQYLLSEHPRSRESTVAFAADGGRQREAFMINLMDGWDVVTQSGVVRSSMH